MDCPPKMSAVVYKRIRTAAAVRMRWGYFNGDVTYGFFLGPSSKAPGRF